MKIIAGIDSNGHLFAFRFETDQEKRSAILNIINFIKDEGDFGTTEYKYFKPTIPMKIEDIIDIYKKMKNDKDAIVIIYKANIEAYEKFKKGCDENRKRYEDAIALVNNEKNAVEDVIQAIDDDYDIFSRGTLEIVELK